MELGQPAVLLIEPSVDDAYFLKRAFQAAGLQGTLVHATSVAAAESAVEGLGRPRLVIVGCGPADGAVSVRILRGHPLIADVPVVALVEDPEPGLVESLRACGVGSVVPRPMDYEETKRSLCDLLDLWLGQGSAAISART
jgi:CheY-like chemotaxis protein